MKITNTTTKKYILLFFFSAFFTQLIIAQNSAINFSGSTGEITVPHSTDFNIGEGFTIEAWINASEWKNEVWGGTIISKDAPSPDAGFAFRSGNNGSLSFVMSANQSWNEAVTSQIMQTGQWYHVAAVVDDGAIRLYINGNSEGSASFSGTPTSNTRDLHIGESAGFAGRVFNGAIDEVRIWNIARTGQEIADNISTEFTGMENGLVAYFPMNEGSGLTTTNLVGGGDATFANLGEDAWVEGYAIPSLDVGVISVEAPDILALTTRPVRVQVAIQNYGTEPATDIPVAFRVNNDEEILETATGTLQPGEVMIYTFNEIIDLTENVQSNITARTILADDGNTLNDDEIQRYRKESNPTIIKLVDNKQHNFGAAGQTQFSEVNLPLNLQKYQSLLLHISVDCPFTGCDPWDQPAKITAIKDEVEYEIARFITPYGKACGPWTVDVTDFKEVLEGNVSIKSFIQVFGTSGWILNADLELVEGDDATPYKKLTTLWNTDYQVYGEPTISHDLEEKTVEVDDNTTTAHLRMTISGHGQGNTDNAAEFSQKTHTVVANGSTVSSHFLWKNDCGANPCDNQGGNWTPSRAGWCPGQEVAPYVQDLTSAFQAGGTVSLDYELEDYVNLLNTGYNNGSHTEPHYRIWGYAVESSPNRYDTYNNLDCQNLTVELDTVNGVVSFGSLAANIVNDGNTDMQNTAISYFVNGNLIVTETITETIAGGESFEYQFASTSGYEQNALNEIVVLISNSTDENINDDIAKSTIDALTSTTVTNASAPIQIFPNPSSGDFQIIIPTELKMNRLIVSDLIGRTIFTNAINEQNPTLSIKNNGVFLLQLFDDRNIRYTYRLNVLK